MAIELSETAQQLARQTNIQQQIIVEFDNIPFLFSTTGVSKLARYGDDIVYGQAGLVYGGVVGDDRSRPYIDIRGTTNNIQQQVEIDKGGSSSITNFRIRLIDPNEEVSFLFSPNEFNKDPLSVKSRVYLNFVGGAHPEDSALLFNGTITAVEFGAGFCDISLSSPNSLARQELFTEVQSNLTSAIDSITTNIPVTSTNGSIPPADTVRSFIRIDDEIMEYDSFSGNSYNVIQRGALGTVATSHDIDEEVSTFYEITDDAIDMALKLMLSDRNNSPYIENVPVPSFEVVSATETVDNAILITQADFLRVSGVIVGDKVTITGATNAQNNVVEATVISIGESFLGDYLVLDQELVNETESSAVMSVKSKYNVYPEGGGLSSSDVDIERHEQIKELFPNFAPPLRIYIKETINLKEFVEVEVYFPSGLYSTPRNGNRASVSATVPPLALNSTPTLSSSNIKNGDGVKISRSSTKYFYNSIVYRFEQDAIEDRFLAGEITLSTTSTNVINVGNKALTVSSAGLRRNSETVNFIRNQSRRFLDTYQKGSEVITVDLLYRDGFTIEVGDTVIFDGGSLKVTDIRRGSRDFKARIFLVRNRSISLTNGNVRVSLLDTSLGLTGRYTTIAPSSSIASGSTQTVLRLQRSQGTPIGEDESVKWSDFIGEEVEIHSQDYSFREIVTILGINQDLPNALNISPLSTTPLEDYVIDQPDYPDNDDADDRAKWKNLHGYLNPSVDIIAGVSESEFEVSPADIDKFVVGSYIRVHNDDFSVDSQTNVADDEPRVEQIVGNNIILTIPLPFVPASNEKVALIGFKDGGLPYRII
jgi:hypothetical protein